MRSCREIIKLSTGKIDQPVAWSINLEIKLHLLMCKKCARYVKQVNFIQTLLDEHMPTPSSEHTLSSDARQRIGLKLKQSDKK